MKITGHISSTGYFNHWEIKKNFIIFSCKRIVKITGHISFTGYLPLHHDDIPLYFRYFHPRVDFCTPWNFNPTKLLSNCFPEKILYYFSHILGTFHNVILSTFYNVMGLRDKGRDPDYLILLSCQTCLTRPDTRLQVGHRRLLKSVFSLVRTSFHVTRRFPNLWVWSEWWEKEGYLHRMCPVGEYRVLFLLFPSFTYALLFTFYKVSPSRFIESETYTRILCTLIYASDGLTYMSKEDNVVHNTLVQRKSNCQFILKYINKKIND